MVYIIIIIIIGLYYKQMSEKAIEINLIPYFHVEAKKRPMDCRRNFSQIEGGVLLSVALMME